MLMYTGYESYQEITKTTAISDKVHACKNETSYSSVKKLLECSPEEQNK